MSPPWPLPTCSPPLRTDADGVVRVGATRVTLDIIVDAFRCGLTAEEIALQYDSLDLADVYATIAHYLRNQSEIDAYLAAREAEAKGIREDVERRHSPAGIRERLLARKRLAS